jgi:small GTP-binding protein
MAIKIIPNFFRRIFFNLFTIKKDIKLGFYGPPNSGKTTLANRICKDWMGDELGKVSKIPHETRKINIKEKVEIDYRGKSITFKLVDTPGIATKIDYEDFMRYGLKTKEAKRRAREATKGVIESIKWLDDMDSVIVVLDSSQNPYTQVNITIIGNLVARKIPVLVVANKTDRKKSNVKKIEAAFPEYEVVGISAKYGKNMEEFYESLFNLVKKGKKKKKKKEE